MTETETSGPDLREKYDGWWGRDRDGTAEPTQPTGDPAWVQKLTDVQDRPKAAFLEYVETNLVPALRSRYELSSAECESLRGQADRMKSAPDLTDGEIVQKLIDRARRRAIQ